MRFDRLLTGIDSHTGGEPTRVITAGLPRLDGTSMSEQLECARQQFDDIRRSLVSEPRGHDAMVVAYLLPAARRDADYGVIFMNNVGYLGMCGHGIIGVATVLVELGMVTMSESRKSIIFDTPAGVVETRISMSGDRIDGVTIRNVASYVFQESVELNVGGIGRVVGDIAYGGNWFFLVRAEALEVDVDIQKLEQLLSAARDIRATLDSSFGRFEDPVSGDMCSVDHIKIYEHVQGPISCTKSFVLCPGGVYDRSPCGTGMSAEMALMFSQGRLKMGFEHTSVSIVGSRFRGRVVQESTHHGRSLVTPEITGQAYVTNIGQFVLAHDDPFKFGLGPVG